MTWSSDCYDHFAPVRLDKNQKGEWIYVFECITPGLVRHPSVRIIFYFYLYMPILDSYRKKTGQVLTRLRTAVGNSNLIRHIRKCTGVRPDTNIERMEYSYEAFRYLLCEWLSSNNRPFILLNDAVFRSYFLCPLIRPMLTFQLRDR